MNKMVMDTVQVFGYTLKRLTTDDELDEPYGIALTMKELEEEGTTAYGFDGDGFLITAFRDNDKNWELNFGSCGAHFCGGHLVYERKTTSIKQAESDVIREIKDKMKAVQKMYAAATRSKTLTTRKKRP